MKKFLINLALVAGAASAAFAQGDPSAQRQLDDIRHGRANSSAIELLYVKSGVTLPAGSIETADLADGAVTAAKIGDVAIGNANLAANCVSSANIVNGGVSNADLATGIDGGKLTAGTVSNAAVASGLSASKVTTGNLPVAQLTNALAKGNTTLDIRTGSCTNGETISFSPAFGSTPFVVGNYVGDLVATETNSYGSVGGSLRVKVLGVSSFVLAPPDDATYHTNRINYIAIYSAN